MTVVISVSETGRTPPRFPALIPTTPPSWPRLPCMSSSLLCLDPSCQVNFHCAPGTRDPVAVFTPRIRTGASPACTLQRRGLYLRGSFFPQLLASCLSLPLRRRFHSTPSFLSPCPLLMASREWEACPPRSSPPRGAQSHQIRGRPRHHPALCPPHTGGTSGQGPPSASGSGAGGRARSTPRRLRFMRTGPLTL